MCNSASQCDYSLLIDNRRYCDKGSFFLKKAFFLPDAAKSLTFAAAVKFFILQQLESKLEDVLQKQKFQIYPLVNGRVLIN